METLEISHNKVRLTPEAYKVAKINASKENMHIWEYVSKCILEKDILEKLVQEYEE